MLIRKTFNISISYPTINLRGWKYFLCFKAPCFIVAYIYEQE